MAASTMHFGPEWMRTKQSSAKPQPLPSPPLPPSVSSSTALTYSSLVSASPSVPSDMSDEIHPFRYSKEAMIQIFTEGGGHGGLGLEIERWDGVVREVGIDPIGLREMSEVEKKLFAGPLNSELRRRQSSDYLSPVNTSFGSDRSRLAPASSSPMRERFGPLRRRDSSEPVTSVPQRKLSLTNSQTFSPRDGALPSPRAARFASGFDGILGNPNTGEAWVSRRRTSEASLKPRDLGGEHGEGIREEEEESGEWRSKSGLPRSSEASAIAESSEKRNDPVQNDAEEVNGVSKASVDVIVGPPPGLAPKDLASVEWSYLDPQGQIQGPFRADLMQKWHDDGYFTSDLLMKRTSVDQNWTPLGVLAAKASGGKLFLSHFPPPVPPSVDEAVIPLHNEPGYFSAPLQPAPIRSLRSANFDSYLGGSNHSGSPASSFGAGRYGGSSPDAYSFGERGTGTYSIPDPSTGRGMSTLASEPLFSARRDGQQDLRSSSLPTISQGASADPYPYTNSFGTPSSPWSGAGAGSFNTPFDSVSGEGVGLHVSAFGRTSQVSPAHASLSSSHDIPANSIPLGTSAYESSYSLHEANALEDPLTNFSPYGNVSRNTTGAGTSHSISTNPSSLDLGPFEQHHPVQAIIPESPWSVQDVSIKRPDMFEPHSSSNPVPIPIQTAWTGSQTARFSVPETESPWQTAQQPAPWLDNTSSASSEVSPIPAAVPPPPEASVSQPKGTSSTGVEILASSLSGVSLAKKASTSVLQSKVQSPPSSAAPPPPSAPVTSKPAWVKEDDSKAKPSLREIQEAEAKKGDSRKGMEKEKPLRPIVAPLATTSTSEEPQSFTWGLPTSLAGTRSSVPTKESAASPSNATAVWANGGKASVPAKKSMKEIQEEEEKRKKSAAKESAPSQPIRRAYAETTTKAASSAPINPWTTVGPSGKPIPPPSLSKASPAASSATPPQRPNGTAPTRSLTAPSAVTKSALPPAKIDDHPPPPSLEFLKWLSEALKGLNNSVNVEEIMSMLLSFPLDPDASTVEIISDLIYANSTTLDGRRFAADFISRRKADAASKPKGAGQASKTASIADVVKAQPKPAASSEWGGFKVVNKKKKGGR